MALSKSANQALASQSNAAGGTVNSAWFLVGYGVSGLAVVTNGATGPTVPADVVVQVSPDNGTTVIEKSRQATSNANSAVSRIEIGLGVGGQGGDWGYYRISFQSNTAQAVTVQYDGQSTTAL